MNILKIKWNVIMHFIFSLLIFFDQFNSFLHLSTHLQCWGSYFLPHFTPYKIIIFFINLLKIRWKQILELVCLFQITFISINSTCLYNKDFKNTTTKKLLHINLSPNEIVSDAQNEFQRVRSYKEQIHIHYLHWSI